MINDKLKELHYNQRRMKRKPTKAEKQFHDSVLLPLKTRYGIKHLRQSIVYEAKSQNDFKGYILDFYIAKYKLCIEIDGKGHSGSLQQQYDEVRASLLGKKGIKTIRFTNEEVAFPDDCLRRLYQVIVSRELELKKRKGLAIKAKFIGSKTQAPLKVNRERELEMQAKFIAEHGIKVLPTIHENRKFRL